MDIDEMLRREASLGQSAYARQVGHEDGVDDIVRGVRWGRRRRRAAEVGVVTAAVAGIVTATLTLGPQPGEPAAPTPGTTVWSTQIGSQSWSSAALVGDATVVLGADDGVIRALDVGDGEQLWEVATGGRIRSEVVTDGDMAFVASDDGFLYAVSQEGVLVWRVEISGANAARDEWKPFSAAPLVVGDKICLGDREGGFTCVFADTGDTAWSVRLQGRVTSQAATDAQTIYVGADDARLYALDARTGETIWTASTGGEVATAPAVAEGIVISGSRGTEVVGFDAVTGEALWSVSMGTSWAEAAPAIADGVAYFGSSLGGHVSAVDVAKGQLRWRTVVGGLPWARPAVAGDQIFVSAPRTDAQRPWVSTVYALDRASGAIDWTAATGPALDWRPEGPGFGAATQPLVVGDVLIVSGLDGTVYAFAR